MQNVAQQYSQPQFVEDILMRLESQWPPGTFQPVFNADESDINKVPSEKSLEYVVVRPDYNKSIGLDNLHRTKIYLQQKEETFEVQGSPDGAVVLSSGIDVGGSENWKSTRTVNISNIIDTYDGNIVLGVSFETAPMLLNDEFPKTVTRHYVDASVLKATRIKVTIRDREKLEEDIFLFLKDGFIPAQT